MVRKDLGVSRYAALLFVSGEPDPLADVRGAAPGFSARFTHLVLGGPSLVLSGLRAGSHERPEDRRNFEHAAESVLPPWHLPPSQMAGLEVVRAIAERERCEVLVIDVNRPGGFGEVVEHWVHPIDVLPLLVRPDGARLEGAEKFRPATVRRFLTGR